MKNRYLNFPWNTSLTEWYKRWLYIREEPGNATFCDVGVAEPPKCLGPPTPVIVLRTPDSDAEDPPTLEVR